jgi:hypothetical protein
MRGGRHGARHRRKGDRIERELIQRHRTKRNFGDGAQAEILETIKTWPRWSFAAAAQKVSALPAPATLHNDSLIVDRRTTAPHGLTGAELNRLSGALAFMRRYGSLWWATTDKGTSRDMIGELGKRITRLQREHGLHAYSATVFEASGGLHAHIVFLGDEKIAQRLQRSTFGTVAKFDRVTAWQDIARKYLCKERTPQAGYRRAHMLGGRLRGSHRLAGGGDRVRLSADLRDDAVAVRYIEPWRRTNAKRSAQRKPYRPRRLTRTAPRLAGQISLLPEIERPVSRLRNFRGGIVPAAVAREIEFQRRRHGWTQRALAAMIGCKQPQLSNALRGHDPVSSFVVNRLRDIFAGSRDNAEVHRLARPKSTTRMAL